MRRRHQRRIDEAAGAHRVPEREQGQPRRREHRDPHGGAPRLRLHEGKRTMDHPFIPRFDGHRQPGKSRAPPALARVEAHVLRWPVKVPVRTSFGTMHDRPAVLVRVEDAEGAHGWGEAWCNFPSCGAEHRARLIESVLAPLAGRPRLRLARGGVRGADARGPRCSRSSRASRGRSPRRSPASTSPCTTWRHGAAACRSGASWRATRAKASQRRRAGLCQRHQSRAARRHGRGAARRRLHRVQAQGRLRRRARRRQPGRGSRRRGRRRRP